MKRLIFSAFVMALSGCASHTLVNIKEEPKVIALAISLPDMVSQGSLVIGRVQAGSHVMLSDQPASGVVATETELKVAENGRIVFGVGRDETQAKILSIRLSNGETFTRKIEITPRQFNIENINGVPENTVNPPSEIAARIEREQAEVVAARLRNDDRRDFDTSFIWPVEGRVSGVYGSQRIYNGTPKSWHSGMDVAAAQGTPIKAPAGGIVTFAKPDLYLTGGTVLIDHGMGVSSNFLHLSQLDVKVGDRVEQGQVIGLVGATGRATGPHMHWGMNWLKVRIDPQLLVPALP
jgi:murein DD-endopeptidase MepM/ murein hydrolase activator NlpD